MLTCHNQVVSSRSPLLQENLIAKVVLFAQGNKKLEDTTSFDLIVCSLATMKQNSVKKIKGIIA